MNKATGLDWQIEYNYLKKYAIMNNMRNLIIALELAVKYHQGQSGRILPRDRAFDVGRQIEQVYPLHARRHKKGGVRTRERYPQPSKSSQRTHSGADVRHRILPHVRGGTYGKRRAGADGKRMLRYDPVQRPRRQQVRSPEIC